jgi:hypothetical protein
MLLLLRCLALLLLLRHLALLLLFGHGALLLLGDRMLLFLRHLARLLGHWTLAGLVYRLPVGLLHGRPDVVVGWNWAGDGEVGGASLVYAGKLSPI